MELLTRDSDLVEAHLARYASFEEDAFTALNTAFIQDGAVVVIPDNAVISRPIELLFLTGESSAPLACHPRSLVLLGRNAKVTVIERYLALEGGEHFANAITEVALGPGASLSYYRLQPPGGEAFHVGTTQVWQGRDSRFAAFTISMSGRLTRNNVRILLEGEGASCTLDGLYLASGQQHVDTHTLVHHARPHTGSQQRYKGALAGRAHGVFHGRVLIPRDAFQARAHQVNKNLLLSDEAEADTKPQLEIFTDDVKCTHGASVGQLDDEAVFYLTARGLRQHDARLLLTYGFTREMLEAIQQERVRAVVEGLVDGWLTASLERA
jgi:Fe-S cluster assembly protein SufD